VAITSNDTISTSRSTDLRFLRLISASAPTKRIVSLTTRLKLSRASHGRRRSKTTDARRLYANESGGQRVFRRLHREMVCRLGAASRAITRSFIRCRLGERLVSRSDKAFRRHSVVACKRSHAFTSLRLQAVSCTASDDIYLGSWLNPIRNVSTACAAWRPSRIAQTTSDWPRRMSPQANTLDCEVL
jgi:hypothetical protein